MRPKFPTVPQGNTPVRAISPSWFQELRRFCEWAADHPRGDGATILNVGDGILRAGRRTGGSGSTDGFYSPCFRVSVNPAGRLDITGGWMNRNGEVIQVEPKTGVAPGTGVLCVCSTPDEGGKWSAPEFKITTPAGDAYPIAEIDASSGELQIVQYPVVVALLFVVKTCPLAEF